MSVRHDNLVPLTSSIRFTRRANSLSPTLVYKGLEEPKSVLQERCGWNNLPNQYLNDLISDEYNLSHNKSLMPLLFKIDKIISPCCNFVGDDLIVASKRQLKISKAKQEQADRRTDSHLRDLDLRRQEIEKYNRIFRWEGAYSLNQFIARDEPIDIGGQTGLRLVAVHCWNLNFALAEAACNGNFVDPTLQVRKQTSQTPMSPLKPPAKPAQALKEKYTLQMSLLRPILRGFANLQKMIASDPQIKPFFEKRRSFDIQTPSTGQLSNTLQQEKEPFFNIICTPLSESVIAAFQQQSLPKRVTAVRLLMNFLTEYCRGYSQQENQYHPYFRAVVAFLGNNRDRKVQLYREVLDINGVWLVDQFFFAHRFLPDELMNNFMVTFHERIMRSKNIVNVALCTSVRQKTAVLQNYLDETSDLETVAAFSMREKPLGDSVEFDKFINARKQELLMEGRPQTFEQMEKRMQRSQSRMRSSPVIEDRIRQTTLARSMPLQTPFFMRTIDFAAQKILQPEPPVRMPIICTICTMQVRYISHGGTSNRRQNADDMYIECSKCGHGGHSRHILSWFERNQRCPKSDCICLCN